MNAYPECFACIFKQAINTAKIASKDPKVHEKILRRLAEEVKNMSMTDTPAAVSQYVYEITQEVSGVYDPFADMKKETNQAALKLLPKLEKLVFSSRDPLKSAVQIAVAGNVIDLGINFELDLEKDVLAIAEQDFAIDHIEQFRAELTRGKSLLYLTDNSGEIVFDRVFVEELLNLGIDVTVAVKSGPIINDVTMEDAEFTGLTSITRVIETGSAHIGVNWEKSSEDFKKTFLESDIIISKGHGNFETLSHTDYNIYFLLKAKCQSVAKELGIKMGNIAFKKNLQN